MDESRLDAVIPRILKTFCTQKFLQTLVNFELRALYLLICITLNIQAEKLKRTLIELLLTHLYSNTTDTFP